MLRVSIKGTGEQKRYELDERIVIADSGELVGEDGDQSGRLLAPAGRVLTVAEAEALGVAALLDAAVEPEPKAEAEAKAEPEPRRRGRPRKQRN
jgi:hypothetical protein